MVDDNDINVVKTDVELLKRDVSAMQGLLTRLDTAIDKIANVSNDISKVLALHQQTIERVRMDAEERKRVSEKETELLHRRISDMKDESALERKNIHEATMLILKEMKKEFGEDLIDIRNEQKNLADRVHILEKWKWWIMGGSWVIGFVIATILQVGGLINIFM